GLEPGEFELAERHRVVALKALDPRAEFEVLLVAVAHRGVLKDLIEEIAEVVIGVVLGRRDLRFVAHRSTPAIRRSAPSPITHSPTVSAALSYCAGMIAVRTVSMLTSPATPMHPV